MTLRSLITTYTLCLLLMHGMSAQTPFPGSFLSEQHPPDINQRLAFLPEILVSYDTKQTVTK